MTANNSLYRLSTEMRYLETITESDEDIEINPEYLVTAIKGKVDAVSDYWRFKNDRLDAISNRIKQLQELKQKEEKQIDKLEDYFKTCLGILDVTSLQGVDSKISIQKNPPSCLITNEDMIPPQFITTKIPEPVISIDKKALLAKLKEGEVIEGCELRQGTRIKIS